MEQPNSPQLPRCDARPKSHYLVDFQLISLPTNVTFQAQALG